MGILRPSTDFKKLSPLVLAVLRIGIASRGFAAMQAEAALILFKRRGRWIDLRGVADAYLIENAPLLVVFVCNTPCCTGLGSKIKPLRFTSRLKITLCEML